MVDWWYIFVVQAPSCSDRLESLCDVDEDKRCDVESLKIPSISLLDVVPDYTGTFRYDETLIW